MMTDRHMGEARDALEEARESTQDALEATETAQERLAGAEQEGAHEHRADEDVASFPDLDQFSDPWGGGAPDIESIDLGGGGGSSSGGTTDD
jgi:hypothetical protein